MKKIRLFALTGLCLIFAGTNVYSQGYFTANLGLCMPVGDFAEEDGSDAGGAGIGLGLGLQYTYKLMDNGLGLFGGVDILYNGLKGDVKDDLEQIWEDEGLTDFDIKYPKYFNFPISVGLNFTYPANDQIALLANAGIALNILNMTNMTIEAEGEEMKTKFDMDSNIGFKVGAGALINDKYAVTINYLGLGEHEVDATVEFDGDEQDAGSSDIQVSVLTLCFGIKF
jgi:hypothetical protein